MGKGSGRRREDQAKVERNWDAIFGKKEKKLCGDCFKEVRDEGFWHEERGMLCDRCGISAKLREEPSHTQKQWWERT
tara:strand:+ start:63 stop:293 length:231 start_codon:yes stop_codon:yes gene_type:complete